MPDMQTLVIAGAVWAMLGAFAFALCRAAARGEGVPAPGPRAVPDGLPETGPPPVVADVGGLRAQLRAAAGLMETAQLSVTIDLGGTEAILATTRSVALVQPGDSPALTVPILRDGQQVARLRALRRHDQPPFDTTDRQLMEAVAARLSATMDVADPARTVPLDRSGAMA